MIRLLQSYKKIILYLLWYDIYYIISLRNVPFAYHICFCFHFISLILCLTFDFLSTGCSFLFLSQIHSNVNYYPYIFLEKEKWNYLRKLKISYLWRISKVRKLLLSTISISIIMIRQLQNPHAFPGVTILLSLTIFLQVVTSTIPVSSDSPLLGNLCAATLHFFCEKHQCIIVEFYLIIDEQGKTKSNITYKQLWPNVILNYIDVGNDNSNNYSYCNHLIVVNLYVLISGVTILLSLTVFSQVLADTMPATSDAIPLLGDFSMFASLFLIIFWTMLKYFKQKVLNGCHCNSHYSYLHPIIPSSTTTTILFSFKNYYYYTIHITIILSTYYFYILLNWYAHPDQNQAILLLTLKSWPHMPACLSLSVTIHQQSFIFLFQE